MIDAPPATSRDLARRAFPGGHALLPHEDPASTHPRDARHWMAIYTELVSFKFGLFERLGEHVRNLSPEARAEAERSDMAALLEQRGRYEGRLDFWRSRFWELQGVDLDDSTRVLSFQGLSVALTRREAELLAFLLATPECRHTSKEIAGLAWSNASIFPEQVRTYIGRLRRKLESVDAPLEIANHSRNGYTLRQKGDLAA